MSNPEQTTPHTKDSEQKTLNQSKDTKYDILAVELLAENPGGTALNRLQTDSSGNLKTAGTSTIDTTGLATDTNQTDGSQKSQLVDAGGEAATVTGGKLDVNASIDTTGLATSAKQDTGNTTLAEIATDTDNLDVALSTRLKPADTLAKVTTVDTITNPVAVTGTFWQTTQPISGTVTATTGGLTDTQLRASAVPISLATAPTTPVTGTFWQTTQPVSIAQPSSATVSTKTMTGSAVTLAASNASRKGLYINNNSGVDVYLKFGSAASSSDYTYKLATTGYYELPAPVYTGIVTANGASGDVQVTET